MTDPELVRGSIFYQRLPLISEQPWDELNSGGWNYSKRSGDVAARIVTDLTAPHSPENVLEINYKGCVNDNDPGVHWHSLPNSSKVYWEYWLKLSSDFLASPAGFCKTNFIFSAAQGQIYFALFGSEGNGGCKSSNASVFQLAGTNEFNPPPGANSLPNLGIYEFNKREEWVHCAGYVDVVGKIMRCWQNDVLTSNYVNFEPMPDAESLIEFQFAPTIQSPHWDPSPVKIPMCMYIDHTIIRADVCARRARK